MHLVIFGLTLSSSWGNGHATLWRGLLKELSRRGHSVTFYEKDVPYYAAERDGWIAPNSVTLRLYQDFDDVRAAAGLELEHTDAAIVTSFCPDGRAASQLMLDSRAATKIFYDLDTPVTLDGLERGASVSYLPVGGLGGFDLVLSYTGGRALEELQSKLGAARVAPLYGWADPELHRPVAQVDAFRCSLSYLGTFAADRQRALEELLLRPAAVRRSERFMIGGAQYPADFPWNENIFFVYHLPPELHPGFFCSSRATLNITRGAMADYGFCPSGRLFEAAACGAPILTDCWPGLDSFFSLGDELITVASSEDVLDALSLGEEHLRTVGLAARQRVLAEHTATARAERLENLLNRVYTCKDAGNVEQQAA